MSSPHPPHIQPQHPNSILSETQKHLWSGSLTVDTNHLNTGHFQDQFREWVRLCKGSRSQSTSKSQLPAARDFGSTTGKPLESPSPLQPRSHSVTVRFRGAAQPARICLLCSPALESWAPLTCCRSHLGMASTHLGSALAPALPQHSCSCAMESPPSHPPRGAHPSSQGPWELGSSHRQERFPPTAAAAARAQGEE